jgi:hypothetical protein
MSTLKIEHISHLDNGTPDLSIDSSGHLNIVNGNLQMGGVTMLDTNVGAPLPLAGGTMTGDIDMSSHQIVFNNNSQAIQIRDAGGTASYVFYQDNADTLVVGNGTTVEKIRLDTSGNEGALVIDTDGKVGIGTSSPTRQLDVSEAGTAYIRASDTSSSVNMEMLAASSGGWVGTQSNHSLNFQTNNTEAMRITSAGSVGIGTINPQTTLQVDGNVSINSTSPDLVGNTTTLTIGNSSGGGDGMLSLQSGWGNATYGRMFASGGQFKIGNPQSNKLVLYTANLDRLQIEDNGDIKIINPAASPVNGVNLPGALIFEGNGWNTAEGSRPLQGQIHLWGGYNNPTGGSVEPALVFSLKGTGNGSYSTADGPDVLTERMRLDNYGNLGVGVSSPQNPLHVSGTVEQNATGYIDLTSSYATVFDLDDHVSSWASGVNIYITGRENGVPGANKSFSTYTAVKSNSGWILAGPFNVVKTGNDHGYPQVQVTSNGQLQLRNRLGSNLGDAWVSLHVVCG